MSSLRLFFAHLTLFLVAVSSPAADQAGIQAKKPVFGGACKICPWGAMAEVVQAAMKPYGYDVQICYNCNAADAPRIVSEARMPPPYRPDPAVPEILAPRNAPGLGAIDFGAVAIQFLRNAYRGTGLYAKEKPRTNLRLIANIQDPSYVLVAAKAETGITDLSQIREKRWPVRILTAGIGGDSARILAHFGLSQTGHRGCRRPRRQYARGSREVRCRHRRGRRHDDGSGMENLDGDQPEVRPHLHPVAR